MAERLPNDLETLDKVGNGITKFRLGSHNLKIETGRWQRIPRNERLCSTCGVLGDEWHMFYDCVAISRVDLDLPTELSAMWDYSKVNTLFERVMEAELLDWK